MQLYLISLKKMRNLFRSFDGTIITIIHRVYNLLYAGKARRS